MRKRIALRLLGVAACLQAAAWGILATSGTAWAEKGGNKGGKGPVAEVGQWIPVCILFDDLEDDGLQSDGMGLYCDDIKPIYAIVGENRNIELNPNDTKKRTAGRTFFVDLSRRLGCGASVGVDVNRLKASEPFGDGTCDPCDVDGAPDLPATRFGNLPSGQKFGYPDNAELKINGEDLDDLLVDAPFETNVVLRFSLGGESYRLHWGPFKLVAGSPTLCPESDPVIVTRVSVDVWTFETVGQHLACLYRLVKNSDPEYLGQFVVPFRAMALAINVPEPPVAGKTIPMFPGVLECP